MRAARVAGLIGVTFVVISSVPAVAVCNLTGSYVAASGHVVVTPRCADGEGARYVCRDGSFSHAEHRRGACSGHGGVERELDETGSGK